MPRNNWPDFVAPATGSRVDVRTTNTTCNDLDINVIVTKWLWLELYADGLVSLGCSGKYV